MNRTIRFVRRWLPYLRPLALAGSGPGRVLVEKQAELVLSQLRHGQFNDIRRQFFWPLQRIIPETLLRTSINLVLSS